MWLFLPHSFLSIVALKDDPNGPCLLVRARAAGDIERVFPHARVTRKPQADYAYRTRLPRAEIAQALAAAVAATDYPNFKDAVAEPDRHDAYLETWFALRTFQHARADKPRRRFGGPVQPR